MSYTIQEGEDGFSVYPKQRTVTQTTIADGRVSTETLPFNQVFGEYSPSLFDAYYRGDNSWEIDLDCGAQRWCGQKTTRQVRAALRKCGFDKAAIDALVKKYKATTSQEGGHEAPA